MKRALLVFFTLTLLLPAQPHGKKPKLLLAVVVDQFRYDYLLRFRNDYKAGFARILEHGAVFTDAHHQHFPTVTAVGHSTFLTGATPSISGIVGNTWYDRETGKEVTSVSDPTVQLLGGVAGKSGSSPHRMFGSTLGDELKMDGAGVKVVGISIKDRSAILPAGHMADGAYWFDGATGNWVSSSYYFKDLPEWVKTYNQSRPADKYLGAEWLPFDAKPGTAEPYKKMQAQPGPVFYSTLEATPFGNEIIESMAEQAIAAEHLGKHPGTDILTVSFSANDYVGHEMGPDSPEVHDISVLTDRVLGKLFEYIDSQIGAENVLFVMTADHGVTPVPEVNRARRMPGGRIPQKDILDAVQNALSAKFGDGKWIVGNAGPVPYLNYDLIAEKKLDPAAVEEEGAEALRKLPHIFRVYTRSEIMAGRVAEDYVARDIRNGFFAKRSGDLFLVPEAYYFVDESSSGHGTSHGTPFNYDTHVPIIFMGAMIKPGKYNAPVVVNDIAPTLAAILEVEEPSGSVGRILSEILE
ncbi:MAG: alkaline phosphatase family protein [Bryobacteraceae bacterium]